MVVFPPATIREHFTYHVSSKLPSVSNNRNKSHVILAKCHGMGGIYYNVVSLLFPSFLGWILYNLNWK